MGGAIRNDDLVQVVRRELNARLFECGGGLFLSSQTTLERVTEECQKDTRPICHLENETNKIELDFTPHSTESENFHFNRSMAMLILQRRREQLARLPLGKNAVLFMVNRLVDFVEEDETSGELKFLYRRILPSVRLWKSGNDEALCRIYKPELCRNDNVLTIPDESPDESYFENLGDVLARLR